MSETTRYNFPLRLPCSLKETVVRLAKEDGVSVRLRVFGQDTRCR